jgi:hypothetical protein
MGNSYVSDSDQMEFQTWLFDNPALQDIHLMLLVVMIRTTIKSVWRD